MYVPELKYVFCVMRPRSLWSQISLIKYLNSVGKEPFILIDKQYQESLLRMLKENNVLVQNLSSLPTNYDVVFSESAGYTGFENSVLRNSKGQGKTNIKLQQAISIYRHFVNTHYIPQKTGGTLHGMCMKGQRSIVHFKGFNNSLYYLNVGDPDWDQFKTEDFKNEVEKYKEKHGNKILLLGAGFINPGQETIYYEKIISQAKKRGFKPIIKIHVDRERWRPSCLNEYIDLKTPRFILFAAASYVIENIASSMLAECLFLGKRVGCTPAIRHFLKYGPPHKWIEDHSNWHKHILPKVGKEITDLIPRILTESEIDEFLSSKDMFTSQDNVDKIFGWPRIPNYSEYLFKMVEEKVRGSL